MMKNGTNSLNILLEKGGDYLETRMELLKLQAVRTTSDVTSSLLASFLILFLASITFLLLNIGLAIWIGDLTGKMHYGFFIVSGFYVLLVILFLALRKKLLKKPLHDMLVKKMLN
jgi:hypothetical protein